MIRLFKFTRFPNIPLQCASFATKKAGGSSKNKKDSAGRRLGLKKSGGQSVIPGNIIMRQRGTKFHPGLNTYMGRDHTIHAKTEGTVTFTRIKSLNRNRRKTRTFINVLPPNTDISVIESYRQEMEDEYHMKLKVKHLRRHRLRSVDDWYAYHTIKAEYDHYKKQKKKKTRI